MSEKKLQDYLHFYIGCKVQHKYITRTKNIEVRYGILTGLDTNGIVNVCFIQFDAYADEVRFDSIKPILRRLDDITDEEDQEYHKLLLTKELDDYSIRHDCPRSFHYLIKQGFDLFGLLDSGLAIDSATLPKIN